MVHALAETWRVLRAGGRLVDLRPYASGWPLEILARDAQMPAGPLDDSIGQDVDIACDRAVREVVRRGWFEVENKGSFEYTYYWDSVDGMNAFLKENWKESARVPGSLLAKARQLERAAGGQVQVRVRRSMLIASYRNPATQSTFAGLRVD